MASSWKDFDYVTALKCATLQHLGYKASKRQIEDFITDQTPASTCSLNDLAIMFVEQQAAITQPLDRSDRIRQTFLLFDVKGYGYIDRCGFEAICRKFLPRMSSSQLESIFNQVDTNRDGCVTFADFDRMMRYLAEG